MAAPQHPLVKRIIEQLPPAERYTLSDRQIESLHRAALSLPKASHAINLRWTVPFPGKGFYLVLLAGQERRSRQRLMKDNEFKVLPRIIVILGAILGCTTIFGLAYGQRMLARSQQRLAFSLESQETVHPTVVPFKYTREECETSHREWKDGQCVDYEHDHTF